MTSYRKVCLPANYSKLMGAQRRIFLWSSFKMSLSVEMLPSSEALPNYL